MPAVEPRLQRRYALLVQQHVRAAEPLSAGPRAPLTETSAFAATQAAWRFFHNERLTLPLLVEPLHQVATTWRQQHPTPWALALHDWSVLNYATHTRKKDRHAHGPPHSQGYDLGTVLLVDGHTGDPVAPLALELRTASAVHSTRSPPPALDRARLDEVLPVMQSLDGLALGERVVHIIDREADGLAHYRAWEADRRWFLVRARARRRVRWHGEELSLAALHQRLQNQGALRRCREVTYRGRTAVQHVAETLVVLDRPAWRHRRRGGRVCNEPVPGAPIALRLLVSQVCDARGATLAVWYLLSHVPPEVPAETLALWYYWRWRIESFFKLLKSAGQVVEQWQQTSGEVLARRLVVAAMACTLVWQVERAATPAAHTFRTWLVRLSGRQMKYGKAHTAPALLAGLWVYLAMLDALDLHTVEQLRSMKALLRQTGPDTS
jgi:Transposase DDE domain